MGIFSRWQRKEQDSRQQRPAKAGTVEASSSPAKVITPTILPKANAARPAPVSPQQAGNRGWAGGRILIRPLITEKGARLKAANQYLFEVSLAANKISVARAVEQLYGTRPAKVNILNVGGKSVRYGRMAGQRKSWKKAMVIMPAGKELPVYQGV